MNLLPWQSTVLALLGCAAGLLLHLRWHPLRQELSDAWDFLRTRPWLVFMTAGASLLSQITGGAPAPQWTLAQLTVWREVAAPLLSGAAGRVALLPHALAPAWPMACLMPLLLGILTVRVWRWPYRYARRRPGPEQKFLLLGVTLVGFAWLALEGRAFGGMQEESVEMLRLGLRYCFMAITSAVVQIWVTRLLMAWEMPEKPHVGDDAVLALEHTFARWQSVACLAGFNLGWMLWRHWLGGTPGLPSIGGWLWLELLVVFAALPVAVAACAPPFVRQGAAALLILLRSMVPLALLAITAVALLLLAHFASATAEALSSKSLVWRVFLLPLNALGLAMLDSWLMLTALLLMLRLGFPRSPTA